MAKIDKEIETIKKITSQLFKLLGVAVSQLKASSQDDFVHLDIKVEEPALVIGHHGEIIGSLQLIIALMAYHQLGKWQKIVLNINDWRAEREEYLKKIALNLAQKVKFSGKPMSAPYLTPFERRVVHLYLADHPDVETYSEGEGRSRRLVIKPKGGVDC